MKFHEKIGLVLILFSLSYLTISANIILYKLFFLVLFILGSYLFFGEEEPKKTKKEKKK